MVSEASGGRRQAEHTAQSIVEHNLAPKSLSFEEALRLDEDEDEDEDDVQQHSVSLQDTQNHGNPRAHPLVQAQSPSAAASTTSEKGQVPAEMQMGDVMPLAFGTAAAVECPVSSSTEAASMASVPDHSRPASCPVPSPCVVSAMVPNLAEDVSSIAAVEPSKPSTGVTVTTTSAPGVVSPVEPLSTPTAAQGKSPWLSIGNDPGLDAPTSTTVGMFVAISIFVLANMVSAMAGEPHTIVTSPQVCPSLLCCNPSFSPALSQIATASLGVIVLTLLRKFI